MARVLVRSTILAVALCAMGLVLWSAVEAVRGRRPADDVEKVMLAQAVGFAGHQTPYTEAPTAVDRPMPGLPFAVATLLAGERPRLWHLRAVAFLAMVTLAVLVLSIVQIESGSWALGVVAASLALLGTALVGPAPGAARPETLALVLVLIGCAALRHTVGRLGALLAALPLAAAWFVDAQAGWALGAVLLALAVTDAERAGWFGVSAGLLVAGGYVALSRVLGPWFNFAAWDAAWSGWRPDANAALQFVTTGVLGRFGPCAIVTVLSCAMAARPWSGRRGLWACLAAGTLVGAIVATQRATQDGTALAPCILLLCMVGTLSLQRVARHLSATFDSNERDGEGVVLAGLALQLLVLGSLAATAPWVGPLVERLRAG